MTTTISPEKNISVLLFILLLSLPVLSLAQNSAEFAQYLMAQKDYFRAISVYKQLLFESNDREQRYKFSTHIAEAYRLSGKHKSSIYFYSEALQHATTGEEQTNSLIGLGLNYYQMNTIPIARNYFVKAADIDTTAKAKLFIGLMYVEAMNWSEAKRTFEMIATTTPNLKISERAKLLLEKSNSGANLPRKSPLLAAIMSALLPGSGQFYSGHYFDGIQALSYVGAFSLATYSAYRYDRDINDSDAILLLSATITSIFYSANILGAYQTAKFRNMRIRQNFMNEVKSIILEVTF